MQIRRSENTSTFTPAKRKQSGFYPPPPFRSRLLLMTGVSCLVRINMYASLSVEKLNFRLAHVFFVASTFFILASKSREGWRPQHLRSEQGRVRQTGLFTLCAINVGCVRLRSIFLNVYFLGPTAEEVNFIFRSFARFLSLASFRW